MTCAEAADLLAMFTAFFLLGLLLGLIARSVIGFIESASWPKVRR